MADSNTGKYLLALIIIVLLLGLAFTKPSRETHRAEIYAYLQRRAAKEGFMSWLGLAIGTDLGLIDAHLEYHDYVVFSVVTCKNEGVTFGILNTVFLVESE